MNEKTAFYQRLHDQQTDYSGMVYDFHALLKMRLFADFLPRYADQPMRILDVGCGKGFFLNGFCEEAQSRGAVIGTAVGLDLIRSDGNVFDRAPDRYRFVQGSVDGERLPFEEGG
jgi:ubiquinone/menaquinone biosynthesis C-methylase UbiE